MIYSSVAHLNLPGTPSTQENESRTFHNTQRQMLIITHLMSRVTHILILSNPENALQTWRWLMLLVFLSVSETLMCAVCAQSVLLSPFCRTSVRTPCSWREPLEPLTSVRANWVSPSGNHCPRHAPSAFWQHDTFLPNTLKKNRTILALCVLVRQLLAAGRPVLSDHAPHPVCEGGAAGPEPVRALCWHLLFQGESLWMR